ncbi:MULTISPECIES: hypothetical protein [unclassified Kitasatospora]
MSVEHSIITAIWHMVTDHVAYQELGGTYFTQRPAWQQHYIVFPRLLFVLADLEQHGTSAAVWHTLADRDRDRARCGAWQL